MTEQEQEIHDLLDPILDLFGGADGGVAFARLKHALLPEMWELASTNQKAVEFQTMVRQFSKTCDYVLKGK
jgi:hypothetical protein